MDEELIERKKDIIYESLNYLEQKDFEQPDFESVQAVKHSLQEAIEASLDIANHIIASKELPRAEEYSEMFEVLGDQKLIDEELASNLAGMARFRNLLVHRYAEIEKGEIKLILDENLQDLRQYMEEVDKVVQSNE